MRNLIIALVVAAITARFVGFTTPGHRLLNAIGFTTACDRTAPACEHKPGPTTAVDNAHFRGGEPAV
jgi:hypothetical protein